MSDLSGKHKPARAIYIALVLSASALNLGGCTGLFVPEVQEFYTAREQEKFDENIIVAQIKCELHKAVQDTLAEYSYGGPNSGNGIDWLRSWGAKVSFALTVDEKGGLNPGLTFMQPLENKLFKFPTGTVTAPQSSSVGLGLQASSDATRKETIGFTYSFQDLLKERPIAGPCDNEDGVLINSDLKIGEFISNKAFIAKVPGAVEPQKPGDSPYTTFTYEATFVVVYGGNVTPTWKLARISANASAAFLSMVRTKTDDVIITLGPIMAPSTPTAAAILSPEAESAHLAAEIGQAVANAIQSQQH